MISLINRSTVVSDSEVTAVAAALTKQVRNHFAPRWNVRASKVAPVAKSATPSPRYWQVLVEDDSDMQGALGYHDFTADQPTGKVFARSCKQDGVPWASCASHELLELLADPLGAGAIEDPTTGLFWAAEVADPVEHQTYDIDGVAVSNFVYPDWFVADSPGPFDHIGLCSKPFEVVKAGGDNYAQKLDVTCSRGWQQLTARGRYLAGKGDEGDE